MKYRNEGCTQESAAAKVDISERSGRNIETGTKSLDQIKVRPWRTRKNPFSEVWDSEIVPLLNKPLEIDASRILEELQDLSLIHI